MPLASQIANMFTLKRTNRSARPHEVDIGLYFSSGTLTSHAANHCAPIYGVITLQANANIVIFGYASASCLR